MEHDPTEQDALQLALGTMVVLGVALYSVVHEPAFLCVALAAGLNELVFGATGRCLFRQAWLGEHATEPTPTGARERRARLVIGALVVASIAAGITMTSWALAVAAFMGFDAMQSALTQRCLVRRLVGAAG